MQDFNEFLAELDDDLERLRNAVSHLAHVDDVYWQVQAILRSNDTLHGDVQVFQQWMTTCYAESIAVGLRRLADHDSRSFSLYRILEKVKQRASEFTRTWYVSLFDPALRRDADTTFSTLVGGDASSLNRATFEAKQAELDKLFEVVSAFVDQFVAHSDEHPRARIPTFSEVRESLVSGFQILRWVHLVVDASGILSPVPGILANWTRVFRIGWLKPGQQLPSYVHLDELLSRGEGRKDSSPT